jgi:hypothetical protein
VRGTQEELNFPLSNYANDEFLLVGAFFAKLTAVVTFFQFSSLFLLSGARKN